MRLSFPLFRSALVLLAAAPAALAQTDPHITSWQTAKSAQYARVYQTTANKTNGVTYTIWPTSTSGQSGGVTQATYSDVQRVAYSTNYVYIYTTGLASYTMGNWLTPNNLTYTSWPSNRAAIHKIPRNPSIPTTKQLNHGNGGVLVNGVFVWQNGDAQSYSTSTATVSMSGDGVWNRLAGVAEAFNFDPANGHQPGSGAYHNHINPKALRYQLGDNVTYDSSSKTYSEAGTPTKHSPIIGWANDGLPIYGPYGYSTATDSTSGIRRMTSGFVKRNSTNASAYGTDDLAVTSRIKLPVWAASVQGISQTLPTTKYGPSTAATYNVGGGVTATYSIGTFAEDYEYLGDLGKTQGVDFDLNRQNVRYCVTPEYPSGTYAYFVCIDSSGNTVFPDVINQEYFGTAAVGTGTVTSITESVTEYADAGPAAPITVTGSASGGNVALSWNSAEGATYQVESSADSVTWTTLSSTVTSGGTTTSYTATTSTNYYRVTLTAIASYDTGGTYGTPVGTTKIYLFGTAATAPTITTQPTGAVVTAGTSVTFTVVASGTGTLSYQWKKGSASISGATNASYTISSPTTSDGGSYSVVVTNSIGSTTSNTATLTVNPAPVAPSITIQPATQTVPLGASVTLTVVASGTAPLSYQWSKDGTAITNATNATYAIASAQASDAGSYTVVVTNTAGNVTSNAATLTVSPAVAPTITTQPASTSVTAGSSATFTVVASGTASLSYQWQKNGGAISGATSTSYTISSAQASDAGSYTVVVTNSIGTATSNTATLTIATAPTAPTIATQPTSVIVTAGSTATFTVVANGTAPLGYQWKKNGAAISGATSASYAIANAQAGDMGGYTVTVTNSIGGATSNTATLTVNNATSAPTIATQPASLSVAPGDNAVFTVAASGTAPFTYQWYKGIVAITGATAATYSIAGVQATDAGSYSVIVTNTVGNTTSNSAVLTVSAPANAPTITQQPANTGAMVLSPATFTVVATGSPAPTYQWQKNGVAIPGATSATFTIASALPVIDAATYSVVVTNSAGTVTSNGATLFVSLTPVVPTIAMQPVAATATAGTSVTFSIIANGTAPLVYQWLKDGTAISGATNASLTIASVQAGDAGNYWCVVGNSVGIATSSTVALTFSTAAVAPSITTSPSGTSVAAGGSTTFNVVASGTAPLSYQWYKGFTAISGAIDASYTVASAQAADAGSYIVVVTNSTGSATSAAATLTVTGLPTPPAITVQPTSATILLGASATFSVTATGDAPLSYQWKKNGTAIPGATSALYSISNAQLSDAGNYTVTVANSAGSATSTIAALAVNPPPPPVVPTLAAGIVNLAVRTRIGGTAGTPITGFVLRGSGTGKSLIVRAVGPTLIASFGIAGALADPSLNLLSGSTLVASNDNWSASDAPAMAAVGAFALNAGSGDAVIVRTLAPGTYTTPVSAPAGTSGIVLIECYDAASADTTARLVNASARAYVGTGDDVLIPGFTIAGDGTVKVLIRAVGPGLAAFGVPGTLADPQITLYSGGTLVASNDNWGDASNAAAIASTSAQNGAFALPAGSNDAVLLVSLSAGSYSAVVSGVAGRTGTVLLELYVVQ